MARQIQIRRGTSDEHTNFIGVIGEVTMDTDAKTLCVHDGKTIGGIALAKKSDFLSPIGEDNKGLTQKDISITPMEIMRLMTPDYSSGEVIQSGWTANFCGIVQGQIRQANDIHAVIYINGLIVWRHGGGQYAKTSLGHSHFCTGDVITFSGSWDNPPTVYKYRGESGNL